jgi:ATP-dependent protease Clp ATPase subunit
MFPKRHEEEEILRCSFCSKTDDQVDTLISNPSEPSSRVYVCNECVEVCNAVLEEHQKAKEATVEARLRASVLEEHKRAKEANASVVDRLKAFAARQCNG